MKQKLAEWTSLSLAFFTSAVSAHHSTLGLFDAEHFVEIEGVVTATVWRNPHASFTVYFSRLPPKLRFFSPGVHRPGCLYRGYPGQVSAFSPLPPPRHRVLGHKSTQQSAVISQLS